MQQIKHIKSAFFLSCIFFFSCSDSENTTGAAEDKKLPDSLTEQVFADTAEKEKKSTRAEDSVEIVQLIRKVLNWSNSKQGIDLLPFTIDHQAAIYSGVNRKALNDNLDKLRQTGFFAEEFIENYNRIVLALEKGLKNGNYDPWELGYLPPFPFASESDPWCMCQDAPYDLPNGVDFIEVQIVNFAKGEMLWKWGKLHLNSDPGWKKFSYHFRVVKENGRWKISYLEGFDFDKNT